MWGTGTKVPGDLGGEQSWKSGELRGLERTVEEMPPRRMGSISVVVVFSSRFSFSGGPEPPSPAARLLPGPDMAAAAAAVQGLPGKSGRRRRHFRHLQKTGSTDVDATGAAQPPPFPAHTRCPRPHRPAPHLQQDQPSAAILDLTRRHPASQH